MQERIHPAKIFTVILNKIGPGRNLFFTCSSFTFKQGQNAENDQIKHFQCVLYIKLNVIYSMHSGEDIQTF